MQQIEISSVLADFGKVFSRAGFHVYLVGGAVRDSLMGKHVADYDAATDALPHEVRRLFRRVIPTGIKHGTVTVIFRGVHVEVTTFRAEEGYADARHPDKVVFGVDLKSDLSRRDFTINAMAASLEDGNLIDPFGGMRDLQAKTIRTVGCALSRLTEDSLRAVRAVRFSAVLGFHIEEETLAALSSEAVLEKVRSVSVERFREEFTKILTSSRASSAVERLYECGIMRVFFKDGLNETSDSSKEKNFAFQPDNENHFSKESTASSFPRLGGVLDAAEGEVCVRFALFFYIYYFRDVLSSFLFEGESTSQCAASKRADFAAGVLRGLRYSNDVVHKVSALVRHFPFSYRASLSDAAIRRFIAECGRETAQIVAKMQCDLYKEKAFAAGGVSEKRGKEMNEFKERIKREAESTAAFSVRELKVGGNDLMEALVPRGPLMKEALTYLLDAVIEEPRVNEKAALIALTKEWIKARL